MKYIKQFMIIISIAFMGELLNAVLPFSIPASIYGMAILFVCLLTGIVRLKWIKETGLFLIEIMPVFFIPVCVGLIDAWGNIQTFCIPILAAVSLTTVIVMVITGRTAQAVIRHNKEKEMEESHE